MRQRLRILLTTLLLGLGLPAGAEASGPTAEPRDTRQGMMESVGDSLQRGWDATREGLGDAVEVAREAADTGIDWTLEKARRARDATREGAAVAAAWVRDRFSRSSRPADTP